MARWGIKAEGRERETGSGARFNPGTVSYFSTEEEAMRFFAKIRKRYAKWYELKVWLVSSTGSEKKLL